MTVRRPLWLQGLTGWTADDARRAIDAVYAAPGVVGNGLAVTQNSPVAMNVLVAPGYVVVPAKTATKGKYLGQVTATEVVTITAASAQNRIDIIVAQVLDTVDGADGSDVLQIVAIAGTPSGSPVAPSVPANATYLASVSVLTTDTTIVSARITDKRTTVPTGTWSVINSGLYPSSPFVGQSIYDIALGYELFWNGSIWKPGTPQLYDWPRSSTNATDNFSAGSFITVATGSVTAPAGVYLIGGNVVHGSSAGASVANLRLIANATTLSSGVGGGGGDYRCDVPASTSPPISNSYQRPFTHPGGTLTATLQLNHATVIGTVWDAGTNVWAMGPM